MVWYKAILYFLLVDTKVISCYYTKDKGQISFIWLAKYDINWYLGMKIDLPLVV